ncbi:hypothetical protein NHU_04573 (plasmid) [Rhodovulum sulfidophilum]|uniref:Uncharacterized protein n=1 Tax=Rhodovulum sulfidophilum TaxID=35806 RepID=A0A0D6B9M3_RHOSU|nr:hypothetical protein NHU_04573 [Rhodovulum sulfidophilum]
MYIMSELFLYEIEAPAPAFQTLFQAAKRTGRPQAKAEPVASQPGI